MRTTHSTNLPQQKEREEDVVTIQRVLPAWLDNCAKCPECDQPLSPSQLHPVTVPGLEETSYMHLGCGHILPIAKASVHVDICDVFDCDSAKLTSSTEWQHQGKKLIMRALFNNELVMIDGFMACDKHQTTEEPVDHLIWQ